MITVAHDKWLPGISIPQMGVSLSIVLFLRTQVPERAVNAR